MKKTVICYHGTSQASAREILKSGFRPGTYFARHLEDALGFGGNFVFEAAFEEEKLPENWQFILSNWLSPKLIVSLVRYGAKKSIFSNEKLRNKIFKSNLIN